MFFQAEAGIRCLVRSRGLGGVYKSQLLQTLARLAECEETLGRVVAGPLGRRITHADRLFGFWVEVRKECNVCRQQSAEFLFQRSWQVSLAGFTAPEATVTELFLSSCAVMPDTSLPCTTARCRMGSTQPPSQRWLATPVPYTPLAPPTHPLV